MAQRSLRASLLATALFMSSGMTYAQNNPECLGTRCGAPQEQGGGGGGGGGGSVWVNYTDDGDTLAVSDDADADGKSDGFDNCPFTANRDQADGDGDGIGDTCDNCAAAANRDQVDTDGDTAGNFCDGDDDGDGVADATDVCPVIPNAQQANLDGDALGDVCDDDDDGDGAKDSVDTCPLVANVNQATIPSGAVCKTDSDGDNVGDNWDNCPAVANNQLDSDADGTGDSCDADNDNDSVPNAKDNCGLTANLNQADADHDNAGDACDLTYCYVIDELKPDDCLNPNAPFTVHAGGEVNVSSGQLLRLPLYANRNGAAIDYTWTVLKRPAGSRAAVENPVGGVSHSQEWTYAYVNGSAPVFTPDSDGVYELQLTAKLVFSDRAYPDQTTHTSTLKLNVGETGQAGGCASVGLDLSLIASALGLGAGLRLRRRRQ